ncbi:MAG TPA: sigma-70 family RNA polymerase sigma factor [Polyangia bacterium]|nr:sigma-70 family RNA polymerase sigma factor [Polyangia bacterium]
MFKLSTKPAGSPANAEQETDAALVAAARRRDERACFRIWSRYAPLVFRLIRAYSGIRADNDDLAQEVFLRVFSRIDDVRDPDALRGFVASICLGVARNANRRTRVRSILKLSNAEDWPEVPAPVVEDEPRRAIRHLMALLTTSASDEDRSLFLCRYVEKMDISDVAVAHGMSLGTAKRRVARMTRRISRAMERDAVLAEYASQLTRKGS